MNQPTASTPTPEHIVRREIIDVHFVKYHLNDGRTLHHITEAQDIYFHDHPWPFRSSILSGGYYEEILHLGEDGKWYLRGETRRPGQTHSVPVNTIHRLTGFIGNDCWSLVEAGPPQQEWKHYRFDEQGNLLWAKGEKPHDNMIWQPVTTI